MRVMTLILLGLLCLLCQSQARTGDCQLKLSCEISRTLDVNHSGAGAGLSCDTLTDPGHCSPVTQRELQEAGASLAGLGRRRRRRSLPPLLTVAGQNPQCRQCEVKGALCLLFGLGRWGWGHA